ncbi:MAG TPA: helix-turn-helix domain-containing protein [Ignavibacteriales bacterium]|nr:helix-turn-helix domain-containing protein [Ignavibacteriales bacterium]
MNWQNFILELEKEFRISAAELEKKTSLSRTVIYNLKKGSTARPRQTTIKKLEEALDIKIDDSDADKVRYTQNLSHKNLELFRIEGNEFPIVSEILPASDILHSQNIIGTIRLPYAQKTNCVAIMVSESEMDGILSNGDKLLIDIKAGLPNGSIAACRLKSSREFIRYYRKLPDDWMQFYTPDFTKDPITVRHSEIEALYRVVFLIKCFTPGN